MKCKIYSSATSPRPAQTTPATPAERARFFPPQCPAAGVSKQQTVTRRLLARDPRHHPARPPSRPAAPLAGRQPSCAAPAPSPTAAEAAPARGSGWQFVSGRSRPRAPHHRLRQQAERKQQRPRSPPTRPAAPLAGHLLSCTAPPPSQKAAAAAPARGCGWSFASKGSRPQAPHRRRCQLVQEGSPRGQHPLPQARQSPLCLLPLPLPLRGRGRPRRVPAAPREEQQLHQLFARDQPRQQAVRGPPRRLASGAPPSSSAAGPCASLSASRVSTRSLASAGTGTSTPSAGASPASQA